MSNMSYCRFQNTLGDLVDCEENLHDVLSGGHSNDRAEDRARAALVETCRRIVEAADELDGGAGDLGTERDPDAVKTCDECGEEMDHSEDEAWLCLACDEDAVVCGRCKGIERAGLVDERGWCEECSVLEECRACGGMVTKGTGAHVLPGGSGGVCFRDAATKAAGDAAGEADGARESADNK